MIFDGEINFIVKQMVAYILGELVLLNADNEYRERLPPFLVIITNRCPCSDYSFSSIELSIINQINHIDVVK